MGWSDPLIQVNSPRLNRFLAPVSKIYVIVLLLTVVGMAILSASDSETTVVGVALATATVIVFVAPIGYAISYAYQYYNDRQYVSDTAVEQREIKDPSVSTNGYALIFIVLLLVLGLSAATSQMNNSGSPNIAFLFGQLIGVVALTFGIGKMIEWNRKRKMG